jgi:predicted nucleotidyltransferase
MSPTISPARMERYRESARRREEFNRIELETRRKRGWELARQAAEILKKEFGAERMVVFGSLLSSDLFHRQSDIDLGAWNVQRYSQAVKRLLDLDAGFDFDLVSVEDASAELLAVIEAEGVEI